MNVTHAAFCTLLLNSTVMIVNPLRKNLLYGIQCLIASLSNWAYYPTRILYIHALRTSIHSHREPADISLTLSLLSAKFVMKLVCHLVAHVQFTI